MGKNSKPQPVRKKKTNAEMTQQRKAAMSSHGKKPQRVNTNINYWGELSAIHHTALSLLTTPSLLAPFLRDNEVMSKISNQAELRRLSGIILADTRAYDERLTGLKNKWADKVNNPPSENDLLFAIAMTNEYQDWTEGFTTVVITNVAQVVDMINEVVPEDKRISF